MLIDWHTKRQENRNYLVIFKGLVKKTLKRKWNIYFPLLNCSWYFTLSSSFRIRFISLSCLPKSNLLRSLKVQSIWSKHRLSDSVVLLKYKISCLAQIQNKLSCSNKKYKYKYKSKHRLSDSVVLLKYKILSSRNPIALHWTNKENPSFFLWRFIKQRGKMKLIRSILDSYQHDRFNCISSAVLIEHRHEAL